MGSERAPGTVRRSVALSSVRMSKRALPLGLVMLLLIALAPAAALAEDHGEDGDEPAVVVDDGGAAVPVPPDEVEAADLPWTTRFLPPTLVLLTVLIIVGLAAYYVIGIRRKYEVIGR